MGPNRFSVRQGVDNETASLRLWCISEFLHAAFALHLGSASVKVEETHSRVQAAYLMEDTRLASGLAAVAAAAATVLQGFDAAAEGRELRLLGWRTPPGLAPATPGAAATSFPSSAPTPTAPVTIV